MAVGDDDDSVGIGFAEELLGFGGADFFWLKNFYVGGLGDFFYWREGDVVAASAWTVWLGDDGDDFEVRLGEEMLERGYGELWCAAEEESQWIQSGLKYTFRTGIYFGRMESRR